MKKNRGMYMKTDQHIVSNTGAVIIYLYDLKSVVYCDIFLIYYTSL